jgi:hypothetical protein
MSDSLQPAADSLAQLRARALAPTAVATDWFALGQALLQNAGRDLNSQREALDALVRAYQHDPECDSTLLHTIAQTAFVVRDWTLVEETTRVLLARDAADPQALVWRAASVQHHNDFAEAERLLREAVRIVPANPLALHKLALCITRSRRVLTKRKSCCDACWNLHPTVRTHCSICRNWRYDRVAMLTAGRITKRESLSTMTRIGRVARSRRSARTGRANRLPAKRWWYTASGAMAIACGRCVSCGVLRNVCKPRAAG